MKRNTSRFAEIDKSGWSASCRVGHHQHMNGKSACMNKRKKKCLCYCHKSTQQSHSTVERK